MASYSAGDYDLMSLKEAELRKRNEEVESRQQAALKRVEELKKNQMDQFAKIDWTEKNNGKNEMNSPGARRPKTAGTQRDVNVVSEVQTASEIDLEMESELLGPRMGNEARLRYQAARLKVTQEELAKLVTELNEKDKAQAAFELRIKVLEEENKKLAKSLSNSESLAEKQKKSLNENIQQNQTLEAEVIAVKKELDNISKITKQLESEKKIRDLKLNRALEDLERAKSIAKDKTDAKSSSDTVLKSDLLKIQSENKILARQKSELLNAYKKQMKLIDVLKRQKVHLEASRLLSFTEEEFKKTLDIQL